MTEGYWVWLTRNLKIAWGWIKIIPLAMWDLAKWSGNDLRKMSFSFVKKEIAEMFSWTNISAGAGAMCLVGLVFLLLFLGNPEAKSWPMLWWGLAEVGLFLISTYAYWRDKP